VRTIPLLALLAAFGCAKAEAPRWKVSAQVADQGPRLVGQPPAVQVELPPRMTPALAAEDPGFTTLTPFDFVNEIVPGDTTGGAWRYPYDGRQAPFAVIADFDGDGTHDVALLQRSQAKGRVIALLDRAGGPRAVKVREWDRRSAGDAGKCGFYLSRFRAGPYRVPDFGGSGDTAKTVTLAHEGIEVSNYGKAATTYYWTGDRFESVTTGD
jgi:hypothetical protein